MIRQPKPEETAPPKPEKAEPELKLEPRPLPTIEKAKEAPVETPAAKPSYWEKQKDAGPDLGIKPQKPIEIKKPIELPEMKTQGQPKAPQAKTEQKPVQRPVLRQGHAAKKESQGKPAAPAQTDRIDIKPKKPIEIIPELGR